ncbi:class I SAM-dependent methyltransferase [Streptomyces sp. NPDC056921]|uniref:class I SAM-dependent methyltransferase n=1 Tax=Streptomyces sp. NPDC056921 TaxID=3345966 RepID=UPI00362D890B
MGYVVRKEWHEHYADGKDFRPLGDTERTLLAEHVPVPDGGGCALDVGYGTGGPAVYLSSLGCVVDAVDFADSAIGRARAEHTDAEGCVGCGLISSAMARWSCTRMTTTW